MERFADVFSPSLIVANLAVALSLLAFGMQASTFAGLQRLRNRAPQLIGLRVMRERAAPELLYLLAIEPATAESLQSQIPFRPSLRIVRRTLLRLEEAGAVFERFPSGQNDPEYQLTSRGRAIAIAVSELS